ncbi:MAG: thiamine pyrophosphate-dependent dehydrogenase E1 component subunit alpha [Planctomycetota bacterium]
MAAEATKEAKVRMLTRMLTIRRFEERVKELYHAGEIVGAIHLYIGQEAIAVGTCEALREDDYVTSTHRSHGHTIAKIFDLKRTMAEMMGRETGLSRGRGGSMHMFDIRKGFLGGNGIVGGGIAIGLGAAFSAKYRGTDQVAVCFFSEGGASQGVLHECLNMTALWRLPVIYVLENNRYAATTPVEKSSCTADIAPRAEAYGLPWEIADGNNVLDVYRVASAAVARARAGQGTTFIECKTYRVEPHCGIIPDARDRDEVDAWRGEEKDPIRRFEARLLAEGTLDGDGVREVHEEVEAALDEAIEFARRSAFPAAETVADALWAESVERGGER